MKTYFINYNIAVVLNLNSKCHEIKILGILVNNIFLIIIHYQ